MNNTVKNLLTSTNLNYYKKILQVGALCQTLWIPYLAIIQNSLTNIAFDVVVSIILWTAIYFFNKKESVNQKTFNISLLLLGILVVFIEFENYKNFAGNKSLYLTASMTAYFFAIFLQQTKHFEGLVATILILNSFRIPDNSYLFTVSCVSFCFAIIYAKTLLTRHIEKVLLEKEKQSLLMEKAVKQKHIETISQISKKVSHEVNNQLSEVSCGADLLEILLDADISQKKINPEILSIISSIQRQAQKTSGMIKNLAKIGDFKNIKLEQISCMELNYKLEEMIKKFTKIKSEKLKDIQFEFTKKALNKFVNISLHELEFILFNVLENALYSLNFTDSKFIAIQLREDLNQNKLFLSVRNSGPKIKEDISNKLFKEFVSDKDIQDGSGISLFISNMLISELGGKLSLSQNKDNLVEFTLEFDTFELKN